MMNFYTADLHNYDPNIIMYEHRPFSSCEEMRNILVSNWNEAVHDGDHGYILGDIGNPEILSELNGKITIIMGNHDDFKLLQEKYASDKIEIIKYTIVKDFLILSHEPVMHIPPECPYLNVHGHIHRFSYGMGKDWESGNRYFNAGVDTNGFYPISEDEIVKKIGYRQVM